MKAVAWIILSVCLELAGGVLFLSGCEHECPAQSAPPFPAADTNSVPCNNPPTLIPQPINATLQYDSGAPTNHFYLFVADQYASNFVTFSNLTPGVVYSVIATSLGTNGLESAPSPAVSFILPANTPFLVAQNGIARIRATVTAPATLSTSADLLAWTPFARLQTNVVNDWSLPMDQPQLFFRITP